MMFFEAETTGDGGLLQRLLGITYEILHAQRSHRRSSRSHEPWPSSLASRTSPSWRPMRRAVSSIVCVLLGLPDDVVRERLGEHIERSGVLELLPPESEVLPVLFLTIWPSAKCTGRGASTLGFRPLNEPRPAPDAWHERDTLTLVLPDRDGHMLGYLSADGPIDGQVPSIETLRRMQLFVNLVGLALANSRSHAVEIERRQLLEETARLQNEFFSMVSHEVRSPLAAFAARRRCWSRTSKPSGSNVAKSCSACSPVRPRLSSSSKTSSCSRAWMPGICRCASSGSRRWGHRGVDGADAQRAPRPLFNAAYLDPVPPVLADEGRAVQVLTNLLSNAVKYSFPTARSTSRGGAGFASESRSSTRGRASATRTGKLFTRFGRFSHDEGSTGLDSTSAAN